jgi:hypothetical protein
MKTKRPLSKPHFICSRLWQPGLTFYVRELPGDGGADWGYVRLGTNAVPVSAYWAKRFIADMRRVGAKGVSCREL